MNNPSIIVGRDVSDENLLASQFLQLFKALSISDQKTLLHRLSKIASVPDKNSTEKNPVSKLTTREREVLTLLASGYTRKQIGDALCISFNTAACHIRNIYKKLGTSTTAEATRIALNTGLIK